VEKEVRRLWENEETKKERKKKKDNVNRKLEKGTPESKSREDVD